MKLILIILYCMSWLQSATAQFNVNYDPKIQPVGNLQYFTPKGENLYVGDCIPFFHKKTLYLYWLVDQGHHSALNGLGGHQWVLSTTNDLKSWEHHPVVIGIDEEWEKSICTGSVVYDDKKFYAFYATRLLDTEGKVNEQLSYAISEDAIRFEKQKPNPFYTSAPGYSQRNFRDPKAIIDRRNFHLLISGSTDQNNSIDNHQGCLVHLSSKDLQTWEVDEPVLTGQKDVPECPDHFSWKGKYYLVYSQGGNTFYLMSDKPYGPWVQPPFQALNEDWSNVVKTTEFSKDRRIATSWIPSRNNNVDNGGEQFGGAALFREVVLLDEGVLGTRFVEEMLPRTGEQIDFEMGFDNKSRKGGNQYAIDAPGSIGAIHAAAIPTNCRITFEVSPEGLNEELGLYLRASDKASEGYKLAFSANNQTVSLADTRIEGVTGLNAPFKVEIIMKDDIIDVCINEQRCIVNRLPQKRGDTLWFYAKQGKAIFKAIKVYPILADGE